MPSAKRFLVLALRATLVASLAAAPALAQEPNDERPDDATTVGQTSESSAKKTAKRFSGSRIWWRNLTGVSSFDPGLGQTYNPYFAMAADFRLRVWPIEKKLQVSASIDMVREFTHSDTTTREGETLLGDVRLSVGSPSFYKIPVIDVDLGANLTIALPTSKWSQFTTQIVSVSPRLFIAKQFKDVLAGMLLRYSVGGTIYAHEFTTGGYATEGSNRCGNATLSPEALLTSNCLNSGLRNTQGRLVNSLEFSLSFIDEFSLSMSVSFIHDFLYPQGKAVTTGANYEPTAPRDIRHIMAYGIELTAQPWKPLSIAVGIEDLHSLFHSDPDRTYRHPFDPFTTKLYLDFRLDVSKLVAEFID